MPSGGSGPTFGRVHPKQGGRHEDPSDHRDRGHRDCRRSSRPALRAQRDRRRRRPGRRRLRAAADDGEPPTRRPGSPRGARPVQLWRGPARGDGVPSTRGRRASGRGVGARQRRAASALVRAARRVLPAGRDRILLLRQARRRRVRGQLLPGRARPLQSRHGRRCRSRRSPACVAIRRPCAGGLRRRERGGVDRAAGGGGVRRRRLRRDREPRRAAARARGALRAGDRWSRGHLAASLGSRDRVLEAVRLRPHAVSRTPRRPGAVALRRRRPQRARRPEHGAAALAQAEVRQGLDDRRLPRRRHGLFDDPPTDPRAVPTAEAWVRRHVVVRPERTQPATS